MPRGRGSASSVHLPSEFALTRFYGPYKREFERTQNHPSRLPLPQDIVWACKLKKGGAPTGTQCAACLQTLQMSWPFTSWDTMVNETRSSEASRNEFLKARAVWEEKEKKDFVPAEYTFSEASGYVVEREFAFYTHAQFVSTYGHEPSLLSLTPDTLHDERGQKMSGFVVSRDDKPLTIKVQHCVSGSHNSLLQTPAEQLRGAPSPELQAGLRG